MRVVVADDHHLVRSGIRALLEKDRDITVVGEAADGQQAIELVRELEPDVLVMDIAMPRMNGTQATAHVRSSNPNTEVVILSMHSDESLVREALNNGARGYLLKNSVTEELLLAVRAAGRKETYLSPAIAEAIVSDFLSRADDENSVGIQNLTPRELQIFQLVAEGHTNSGIATLLNVSIKTVEKHRSNLMSKLNVRDIAGLTRMAIKHKLIFIE